MNTSLKKKRPYSEFTLDIPPEILMLLKQKKRYGLQESFRQDTEKKDVYYLDNSLSNLKKINKILSDSINSDISKMFLSHTQVVEQVLLHTNTNSFLYNFIADSRLRFLSKISKELLFKAIFENKEFKFDKIDNKSAFTAYKYNIVDYLFLYNDYDDFKITQKDWQFIYNYIKENQIEINYSIVLLYTNERNEEVAVNLFFDYVKKNGIDQEVLKQIKKELLLSKVSLVTNKYFDKFNEINFSIKPEVVHEFINKNELKEPFLGVFINFINKIKSLSEKKSLDQNISSKDNNKNLTFKI